MFTSPVLSEDSTVDTTDELSCIMSGFCEDDIILENKINTCYGSEDVSKCFSNLAIEMGDYSLCTKLENYSGYITKQFVNNCYTNIALEKRDISICEFVEEEDVENYCNDRVAYSLALSYGDTVFCEKIINSTIKESCLIEIESLKDLYR